MVKTSNEELLMFEIKQLIMSKREDEYWDFKQAHHSSTADLLHDVICMANNKADRNAYIIFGVMDQTGEIIGVEHDEQRRNQQELINQLKSKKFAGGVRPRVEIRTLFINKHEIDVLIILNTMDTPYYLTESYEEKKTKRCVRANHIYTRVGDTNTDIDKSADINDIEYLWKKRFGLHLSPYEKLLHKLKSKETWIGDEDQSYYNRENPEFTLAVTTDVSDLRNTPEFYAYTMTNRSVSYGLITANYYGTTLNSKEIVYLDGARYVTTTPEWGFIDFDKYHQESISYRYFINQDINHLLHQFLFKEDQHEACIARRRFLEVILIYSDENERIQFEKYVSCNKKVLFQYLTLDINDDVFDESRTEEIDSKRIEISKVLKRMLEEYRDHKKTKG